jgi:hypothetical protein
MPHSLTNFRSTVIKPYYTKKEQVRPVKEPVKVPVNKPVNKPVNVQHRNQGRPSVSRNKPQPAATRRSAWQHVVNLQDIDDQFINAVQEGQEISMAFITNKEQANIELSVKLGKKARLRLRDCYLSNPRPRRSKGLLQEVYSNLSNTTRHNMLASVSLIHD